MALNCRVCKGRLLISLISTLDEYVETSVPVSTQCGHLFHSKCIEASLTNQKLVHAREGTGPFRRRCPTCESEIDENSIITIHSEKSLNSQASLEQEENAIERKLLKKIQSITAEKEKLESNLENLQRENENYRDALDEIRVECDDLRSLLKDDNLLKKGDRIFWTMRDGAFAPGRILEMRKKTGPANESPYAILKLDNKTKIDGNGQERDTLAVSVNQLITFKSLFNEFFEEFRSKISRILNDADEGKTPAGRQKLLRSKFRESSLKLAMDSPTLSGQTSTSFSSIFEHETVDSVPIDVANMYKSLKRSQSPKSKPVNRSKTVQFGALRNRPKFVEKYRSVSLCHKSSPLSEYADFSYASSATSPTPSSDSDLPRNSAEDLPSDEFISLGERVIWYDPKGVFPQLGQVAAVLQYTPCAIVKFEDHPRITHVYQYRTVPLEQLFPYDLASPEEKFTIAEAYGNVEEFLEQHSEFLEDVEEIDSSEDYEEETSTGNQFRQDDEEYFSTSSTEVETTQNNYTVITKTHELPL